MRRFGLLFAVALAASCDRGADVFVESPWPADHTVVVLVLDAARAPLAAPAIYAPGRTVDPVFNRFDRFRVVAFSFAPEVLAPNGAALTTCAIDFGEGTRLPTPTAIWSTPLIDAEDQSATAFEAAEVAELGALRLIGCPLDLGTCDGYRTDLIELPRSLLAVGVEAFSDDVAVVGVQTGTSTSIVHRFMRFEGRDGVLLEPPNTPPVRVRAFIWDHQETLYGRYLDQRLFVMDRDTGMRRDIAAGQRFTGLMGGLDGTMLAFDDRRAVRFEGAGAVSSPVDGFPVGVTRLRVHRSDKMFAATIDDLFSFDGGSWTQVEDLTRGQPVLDLLVNDDLVGMVGAAELARVRNEADGVWTTLPPPFERAQDLISVAPLSGGRLVVIGAPSGGLAAWTGRRWCDLSLGGDLVPNNVDSAPPSKIAWITGTGPTSPRSFVVRLEIP